MELRSTFESTDFTINQINGIPLIKINMMRATLKETKEFRNVLEDLIAANHNKIIVDFGECNYIDSSIIGVIVTAVKQVRNDGGDIRVIVNSESLINVFNLTGLQKILKMFMKVEDAIHSYAV